MFTFDIMTIRDDAVVRTNFSQNVSLLCNDLREEIYLAFELSVSCFGSVMRRGPDEFRLNMRYHVVEVGRKVGVLN